MMPDNNVPAPAGSATGTLPQSQALAEVKADSLTELFSRDPEGYSEADMDKLIDGFRQQRARHQADEAAVAATGKKPAKAAKAEVGVEATTANAEDLGL
jgi:uncharacterized protein YdaU (DUF1376 family)